MPATVEQVRALVEREFPDADASGIQEEPDHRIIGTIVWPDFRNYDAIGRNRLVTERIRRKLGLDGIYLGVLYPVTPEEAGVNV